MVWLKVCGLDLVVCVGECLDVDVGWENVVERVFG